MEINNSKPLSLKEACEYLGYAKSYVYKLTSSKIIPFSKPNGGRMYFDKNKLDVWMMGNQSTTREQRDIKASTYISTN